MAGQYTPKDMFVRAPKPLLGRFFQQHDRLTELDFAALKTREYQPILAAWNVLDDETRRLLDGHLLAIHDIASEKGIRAILDAIHRADFEDEESLARLKSNDVDLLERAFIAYLDFGDYWPMAQRFFLADNHTVWYKRRNLPRKAPATTRSTLKNFETAIADYFHQTQGRGRQCKVEALRRNNLDLFIAYPEDYTEQRREWGKGRLHSINRRPAFEVVFIYNQQEGTLDLHCPGGRKIVEAMQALFAQYILGTEKLEPDESDHRIYDLKPLLERTFTFRIETSPFVQSIRLRHFRFTDESTEDRIILATDTRKNPSALHDMLDRYRDAMELGDLQLDQVKLTAKATDPATGEWKSREFNITLPNGCSLKHEGRDLAIRKVLENSDIEPRDPDNGP